MLKLEQQNAKTEELFMGFSIFRWGFLCHVQHCSSCCYKSTFPKVTLYLAKENIVNL